jgi:hypothetical protein
MRQEDEADPKKPKPVGARTKHTNEREIGEALPPLRDDGDLDRHRHVC